MRLLAELVRNEGPEWDEVVSELLAAQVIAYAAYHHLPLDNETTIIRAAYSVSGYPSVLKPGMQDKPAMVDNIVSRVRAIISAEVER